MTEDVAPLAHACSVGLSVVGGALQWWLWSRSPERIVTTWILGKSICYILVALLFDIQMLCRIGYREDIAAGSGIAAGANPPPSLKRPTEASNKHPYSYHVHRGEIRDDMQDAARLLSCTMVSPLGCPVS
jgi:hypothetical protein